jgi:hypothetical protein
MANRVNSCLSNETPSHQIAGAFPEVGAVRTIRRSANSNPAGGTYVDAGQRLATGSNTITVLRLNPNHHHGWRSRRSESDSFRGGFGDDMVRTVTPEQFSQTQRHAASSRFMLTASQAAGADQQINVK